MTINSYIKFNGNCLEAIRFYADVFGVEPKTLTFGEGHKEAGFPAEHKGLIMHAELVVEGNILMFSDVFPGMEYTPGSNISISIADKDKEKLTEWFGRLSEGGKIIMPPQKTSWSPLYGYAIDKFGIGWQVNCYERA